MALCVRLEYFFYNKHFILQCFPWWCCCGTVIKPDSAFWPLGLRGETPSHNTFYTDLASCIQQHSLDAVLNAVVDAVCAVGVVVAKCDMGVVVVSIVDVIGGACSGGCDD